MKTEPTQKQIESVCLSIRHDFGLLPYAVKARYFERCRMRWKAIAAEANHSSKTND